MASSSYSQDVDFHKILVNAKDVRGKLAASKDFISFLADPSSNVQSVDFKKITDSVFLWIQDKNFKVSQAGLDILLQMCDRMSSNFKTLLPVVLTFIIDHLGDNKETLRDQCQIVISKMIEKKAIAPQLVLEKMIPCFTNKNKLVRGEVLKSLGSIIDLYGCNNVNTSKFLPFIAKLLINPNFTIRENALKCLLTIYRHVGDDMKVGLLKGDISGSIPQSKLHQILKKLDDIKLANELLPSAVIFDQYPDFLTTEEVDKFNKPNRQGQVDVITVDNLKKAVSVKPCVKSLKDGKKLKSTIHKQVPTTGSMRFTSKDTMSSVNLQSACKSKKLSSENKSGSSASAGAVDEDYFIRAIDGSMKVQVLNCREMGFQFMEIKAIVGNVSVDWNKRVEALKKLRGLVVGIENVDDFLTQINQLESSIENAVKDLRSQLVREACITISFLAMKLGNKFECFAERILPHIVPLLMSAAKIMSSSGFICLQFVLRHTHSVRLLSVITNNLLSKSKEIRKVMCKLMLLIINTWPNQTLKKSSLVLQDGIKKGIVDADSESRDFARQAYWAFQKRFPEEADSILKNIDPVYHRTILNEGSSMINSRSETTVISASTLGTSRFFQQDLYEEGSKAVLLQNPSFSLPPRSHSATNFLVEQQVKSKIRDGVQPHQNISSETSLLESRIFFSEGGEGGEFNNMKKNVGQTRNQVPRKSQLSGSSASVSSRKTLGTLNLSSTSTFSIEGESIFLTSVQCGDIRSRLTNKNESRMNKKASLEISSTVENRISCVNEKTPVPSSKSIPDVEEIFFQTAVETESVLSESLSNSWSGSQQKILKCSYGAKDLKKIILNCGSPHWSDRKEGLVGLKVYLKAGNLLKPLQLRKITGDFTKMFVDSHTKDFGLFLSTLDSFVLAHKTDLNFWLYVLLTRLLNKLGADLLASIHKKIHKSLDTIRESFPDDILISVMLRYLNDATQTPNSRVKIIVCSFIAKLAVGMDPIPAVLLSSTDQFKASMTTAVTKMIEWTMEINIKKDSNLIKATQEATVALFNLDQSNSTIFLSALPKECQDVVKDLIQSGISQSNGRISVATGSNCSSSIMSPGFFLGKSVQSPNLSDFAHKSLSKKSFCHESVGEYMNYNSGYHSTRQNTAENQHMGYKIIHHKESSQSTPDNINFQPLLQSEKESPSFTNQTNQLSITGKNLSKTGKESNRIILKDYVNNTTSFTPKNQISSHNIDENETIKKTLESIKLCAEGDNLINQNCNLSYKEIKMLLAQLIQIVGDYKFETIADHFRPILRIILTLLDSSELTIRSLVLSLLREMINRRAFIDSFNDYVELLVLKVLKSYKNGNEDVRRSADTCTTAIASQLSPELVIRVVIPLISSEDYPVNLYAIKSLTKVIETRGRDPVLNYLEDIMPGLIHAYDSEESSVRKSAVFCMVALHVCLGQELIRPYISCLCGSKLKLLQIYIKRAEESFDLISTK